MRVVNQNQTQPKLCLDLLREHFIHVALSGETTVTIAGASPEDADAAIWKRPVFRYNEDPLGSSVGVICDGALGFLITMNCF